MIRFGITLACLVAVAWAAQSCTKQSDCKSTECCKSAYQPRGKRQTTGTCVTRVTIKFNCYVNSINWVKTMDVAWGCPCYSGLSCKGRGFREVPQGEVGYCLPTALVRTTPPPTRPPPTLRPGNCNSGADCADNECCIARIQPIGKRAVSGPMTVSGPVSSSISKPLNVPSISSSYGRGYCRRMSTQGQGCLERFGSGGKPAGMVYSCPCMTGYTCKVSPNSPFVVPLGRSGTCSKV